MTENSIICGPALETLQTMPAESINCCISSPPYWALRDYGVDGQLGLEPTFEEYIDKLCTIYDEVFRILRPDGTVFVNLADTYSSGLTSYQNYVILRQDLSIKEKEYVGLELFREVQKVWQTNGGKACQRFMYALLSEGISENQEIQRKTQNILSKVSSCSQERDKRADNKTQCDAKIGNNKEIGRQVRVLRREKAGISNSRPHKRRGTKRVPESNGASNDISPSQKRRIPEEQIPDFMLELQRIFGDVRLLSALKFNKPYLPQQLKSYFLDEETTKEVKAKSLCLIPDRFVIEMVNRGWILRNVIIWHKPNPMPSSAKDRFTVDYEQVFFFVKSKRYFFEPQYEPYTAPEGATDSSICGFREVPPGQSQHGSLGKPRSSFYTPLGRNKRTVWTIPTQSFADAHFATFPEKLVEPMILAGCPREVCTKCGQGRRKVYALGDIQSTGGGYVLHEGNPHKLTCGKVNTTMVQREHIFIGYTDCGCGAEWRPGIVLDCFWGKWDRRQGRCAKWPKLYLN